MVNVIIGLKNYINFFSFYMFVYQESTRSCRVSSPLHLYRLLTSTVTVIYTYELYNAPLSFYLIIYKQNIVCNYILFLLIT